MLSVFKSNLKQSTNLIILCFFLYKLTETLLQYGTRIEIYKTVCTALTNFTKPTENFCSDQDYIQNENEEKNVKNYEILTKVQKLSGIYLLSYRILLNLPAAIACLIYGICSNKFGRKISMLIPCLGATIACTLFGASLSPNINLIYNSITLILIGGTIYGICGKSSAVTMGANSYITDMSSINNRTRMLGRLLGANCLGLSIGTLFLALFLTFLSYSEIIIFCIVNNLFIVIILLFFITDSRSEENSPVLCEHSLSLTSTKLSMNEPIMNTDRNGTVIKTEAYKHHYDNVNNSNKRLCEPIVSIYEQFKLSYNFIFKKYHNEKRNLLLILLGTVLFNQMTKSGEQDIILLYLRNKPTFWTGQLYGYYMACYYVCMFIHLTLFLPIIEHRYTPHDTTLILIGLSLKIFRLFLFSITMNTFWIFFGAIIGSAAGYITSSTRSLISKLVKGDEIGASFALISIMETIANLFGGLLFTLIYNYTITYISSFILLFDAFLHILVVLLFIWLRFKFLIYEKSSNNDPSSYDRIDQS